MTENDVVTHEKFLKVYDDSSALQCSPHTRTEGFVSLSTMLSKRAVHTNPLKADDLLSIERYFHALMRYRCRQTENCLKWLDTNNNTLPKITGDLLTKNEPEWFAVGGMYGGFAYGLFEQDAMPYLITESWTRVVGGSGEQHKITPDKVELRAIGFV